MASEGSKGMEQWELIADTSSLEEGLGPMQLHAAGTAGGFTALQLVCNRPGSPHSPSSLTCSSHWAEMQGSCCAIFVKAGALPASMQDLYLQRSEGLPGHHIGL